MDDRRYNESRGSRGRSNFDDPKTRGLDVPSSDFAMLDEDSRAHLLGVVSLRRSAGIPALFRAALT